MTLHSRAGHFPEPADNAITPATLEHYKDDPNVALLKVRTTPEEAQAIAERATTQPNLERLRYDLFETLGYWQAYLWTRGTANPLETGVPMAASALVEYCYEAIQLDLTPGRQRPQLRARAPLEQRALVERGVRGVQPPDLGKSRDPRPALQGPRPGETPMEVIRPRQNPTQRGPEEWFTGSRLHRPDRRRPAREAPQRALHARRRAPPGTGTRSARRSTSPRARAWPSHAAADRALRAGDTVHFEANEEHWHGADPENFMTHLAMQEIADDGSDATWLRARHGRGVPRPMT